MSGDAWGECTACGEPMSAMNASKLVSGKVVHVGCQAGRTAAAAATLRGDHELNGLLCSVCREPQFDTPSGETCKNGHGGAEGVRPNAEGMRRDPVAFAATVGIETPSHLTSLVREGAKIDLCSRPSRPARARISLRPATPPPSPVDAVEPPRDREGLPKLAHGTIVLDVGPDGTEIIEPPPLAKTAPVVLDPPVHMLVPGHPGHVCCGEPVEGPSADPNSARPRDGTLVTGDRTTMTCPDCAETYDAAEALAARIEECEADPEPTEEEKLAADLVDEMQAEAAERKRRSAEQLAMIKNAPRARTGMRPEGELVHIFDGYPEPLRSYGRFETRCKQLVLVERIDELEVVPFVAGHARCCPGCAAAPAPPYSRARGAFVPVDMLVAEQPVTPTGRASRRRR